jgi:hypothetical protein
MTSNWMTIKDREASKVDKLKRHWVNEGLKTGVGVGQIAALLGIKIADVTAIYYADGHWAEGREL